VFILKVVKVLFFDTLLQVFILKVVRVVISVSLPFFARDERSVLLRRGHTPVAIERVRNFLITRRIAARRCGKECVIA